MTVRLLDWRLRGALVKARVPFRFGIAEMTELVHAFLFVTLEVDGSRQLGVAAENLAPKWFTKNPETTYREDATEMVGVIEAACAAAERAGSKDSVFDLWLEVQRAQAELAAAPLLAGFGASMIERAAIDAFCRATQVSFARAVRTNTLGIRLGSLHAELAGREASELLPALPLARLRVRHTVGLGDPLALGDEGGQAPADGLPASLEGWVRQYRLERFKVKVSGERRFDLDRLARVREVLDEAAGSDYRITLDANEQFADLAALRTFWEALVAAEGTAELAGRVDYVEQPLPRSLALGSDTSEQLAAWPERPLLIIDESDDSPDAVARALEIGYDGGSFKSCKGVFKGIGNACLLEQRRRDDPGKRLLYSAEDLSTIGPVELLADLAVIATLGIDEPERNGYHYLGDITSLPQRVDEETLRAHGDLFSPRPDGRAALRIEEGRVALESVVAAPFGVGWQCDYEDDLPGIDSVVAGLA